LWSASAASRTAAQAGEVYTAEALFDQGRKLMAAQQYSEACPKFAASHRLDPALGTLLNLAYCWKQLGRAASAWSAYREAASLAYWQHQTQREAFARSEAAELETRLARLTVRVADTEHPTLELWRDGVPVPRDVWGVDVPVDPGEYTIEAVAPDHSSFSTRVSIAAGGRALVDVPPLEPLPRKVSPPAPRAAAWEGIPAPPARATVLHDTNTHARDQVADHAGSMLPALTIGAAGAGLVGFGVAGFFALQMRSQDAQARAICRDPAAPCSEYDVSQHRELLQAAHASRTAAWISAGVGAGCALAALALYLVTPAQPENPRARLGLRQLSLTGEPGAWMLQAEGRY
jgi:hypothetical protein